MNEICYKEQNNIIKPPQNIVAFKNTISFFFHLKIKYCLLLLIIK